MLTSLVLDGLARAHRLAGRPQLGPLLRCVLLLVPLGGVLARRLSSCRAAGLLGALSGLALVGALALTVLRGGWGHAAGGRLTSCVVTDPLALTVEGVANVALLAPAAFLAVLAVGRPLRVTAALALVSLGIEGVQAVEWIGVCDSSDAVHNVAGAACAALLAWPLHLRLRPRAEALAVPGSASWPGSC